MKGVKMIKHCFIDLETTGTDPKCHAVIQIAGMITQYGTVLDTFDFTVKPFPDQIIDPKALEVNKRTRDEISTFEPPSAIHDVLCSIFARAVDKYDKHDKMFFVGYYAHFDYNFLRTWFTNCGDKYFGSWFWTPAIDVAQMAILKLQKERPLMQNFKLATVGKEFGIEVKEEELHDAMADIELTKQIWDKVTT
jgi:DNA polymerase-3 subunit epsilon